MVQSPQTLGKKTQELASRTDVEAPAFNVWLGHRTPSQRETAGQWPWGQAEACGRCLAPTHPQPVQDKNG